MKFGREQVSSCEGAVLAHSMKLAKRRLKKGHVLTGKDIEDIKSEGHESLIVAQFEPGDISEDEAAQRLAQALDIENVTRSSAGTGRVNFHCDKNGVFSVSSEKVDAINRIDPGITLATLENNEPVLEGRMVATVKIIPYAVPGKALEAVEKIAKSESVFAVKAYRAHRVGVISTILPSLKESVVDKTLKVLESRLRPSGSAIIAHLKIGHTAEEVAEAIESMRGDCDMIILFGASAICDAEDVIPKGLRQAGGHVERVGMPVDPGNLLMLGAIGSIPVIGAPGCARSPARNGLDFVLERLLAGINVSGNDIAAMGVGGLLMEIGSRPQPREKDTDRKKLAAIILAAGQSRRMGEANKLTLEIDGKPMVRHVAEAAKKAAEEVIVVTGHTPDDVRHALAGIDAQFVQNEEYQEGLSTSLKAGIGALQSNISHAMILLGDMPRVDDKMLAKMTLAMEKAPSGSIIIATSNGKRGNPVIWPKAYFDALTSLSGDTGARHLIGENRENVIEVELGEAASLDVDTPQAYAALKAQN